MPNGYAICWGVTSSSKYIFFYCRAESMAFVVCAWHACPAAAGGSCCPGQQLLGTFCICCSWQRPPPPPSPRSISCPLEQKVSRPLYLRLTSARPRTPFAAFSNVNCCQRIRHTFARRWTMARLTIQFQVQLRVRSALIMRFAFPFPLPLALAVSLFSLLFD